VAVFCCIDKAHLRVIQSHLERPKLGLTNWETESMSTTTEQTGTSDTAEKSEATKATTDFWAQVQNVDLSALPSTIEFYRPGDGDVILGEVSETNRRLHVLILLEVERHNTLVGELREKMRSHYALHEGPDLEVDHNCSAFHEEIELGAKEIKRLKLRVMQMKSLFWASIKLDFPELDGKSIFVADGWKVGHEKEGLDDVARVLVVSSMFGEPSGFPASDSRVAWMDRLFRRRGRSE